VGEGGFGAEPLGVVAGGDQQLAGGVDPDPRQREQGGRDRGDKFLELGVELVEFALEVLPAPGQGPQGGLGRGRWTGQGPGPHPCTDTDQGFGLEPEQGLAELFRGAVEHAVELLGGGHSGFEGAAAGHRQDPDHTVVQVVDAAEQGVGRVCDDQQLVWSFLAHTGLTLDHEPSPNL
jgi:hypothetical protein